MSSLQQPTPISNQGDDASYAGEEQVVADLASSGDRAAARVRLAGFIALHPTCAEAYNDLGVLAFESGDLKAAASSIDQAIALRPSCARYHRNRAHLLLTVGDTSTALAAVARALMLDPSDTDTQKLVTDIENARKASRPPVRH